MHPDSSGKEGSRRLTLLIVDDEEGPRQSLRAVFRKNYEVRLAPNAREALLLASREPVHVAVVDVMMEGLSGLDLLRELKEISPTTEVVIVTAFETLESARQALRYGACDYLNKPFEIEAMQEAVERAVGRHLHAARTARMQADLEVLEADIREQRVRMEIAQTKGEIYASVLHDINSPLTVISAFVEIMGQSLQSAATVDGPALETLRGSLRNVTGQVDRCIEISRRYLSFLAAGTTEKSTTTPVHQILADVKDLLVRHPSAQGHRLVVQEPDPAIRAQINGTDLLQILLNLTINGLHAAERPHEVVLSAELVTTEALRTASARVINGDSIKLGASLIAIHVRDTGEGMSNSVFERLFNEQFTTKAVGVGTGLGLSIVRRLVVNAGGAIVVRSEPGQGAEFTVLVLQA